MGILEKITSIFSSKPKARTKLASQTKVTKIQSLEKKKIPVARLQIGMTVIELDRPWTDLPVLFQEITIVKQKEIDMLQKYCQHVYIDAYSYRTIYADALANRKRNVIYKKPDLTPKQASQNLREEMPRARKAFDKSHKHINQLMKDVERDSHIDINSSKELVSSCVDSILSNETAMFWLSKIKHKDEYTSEHCVRVGILAIAFGKYLQMPRDELELLGLCGMLHDVGKMKVPQHILNKEGALTEDEYQIVKEHTILGYVFLRNHGGIDEAVCTAAYNHHERMNGDGYPRHIEAPLLTAFDRIIGIVDSYDAMTSDRCYRKGMPPSQALSILYKEQGNHYDANLVQEFIQMVGIYPVGSMVELNDGQIAIVLAVNEDHKLEPVVEIITDANHKLIKPIAVDLSKHQQNSKGNYLKIKRALADNEIDFDLEDYVHNAA
ncbi:MAG: HD-GYP domain-containing protein [Kangiellaceae bacterium]|nr:HD-GYP domain-containing protein [Kangiellaceae bacterium]